MSGARTDNELPQGTIPVLVTPFTENEDIDPEALAAEVDYLASAGIRWVAIGFGSEVPRLTGDEIRTIVHTAHDDGRVRVIANADATSIRGARAALHAAHADGADAVLLRPPATGGLPADRLAEAFRLVADCSPLPIIIQDASDMTGTTFSPQMIADLLHDVPQIVGAKLESRDAVEKISRLRSDFPAGSAVLLGGNGGASYARQLHHGVDGTMPGPAFPRLFDAIAAAQRSGDTAAARAAQSRLLPFLQIGERDMDTFIYAQKYALNRQGIIPTTTLRRPHTLRGSSSLDAELTDLVDELEEAR